LSAVRDAARAGAHARAARSAATCRAIIAGVARGGFKLARAASLVSGGGGGGMELSSYEIERLVAIFVTLALVPPFAINCARLLRLGKGWSRARVESRSRRLTRPRARAQPWAACRS
jgi:hypothetical protein